jgi:acyl-CoA synthetase (AMP-forming)/AMP-acid ligase II
MTPHPEIAVPDLRLSEHVLAHGRPDRPALIDGETGEVLTYGELDERSLRLAAGLRRVAGPGDVLALVSHNRPGWAVACHGALRAGLPVAPLSPLLTAAELAAQFRASGARVIVTSDRAAAAVRDAAARAGVRHVYSLDGELPQPPGPQSPADRSPADEVAVLASTSGTTGLPKLAQLTHRNFVANLEQHQEISPVTEQDVFCATIPFSHLYGFTLILNAALRGGATVVTMARFDLAGYLRLLREYGVTRGHFAPPLVAALAQAPGPDGHGLPALRDAVCGAAPVDLALLARAEERIGGPIRQGYGMTEAGPGTHFPYRAEFERTPAGSVGRPVPGTRHRVVDPESGVDVPAGRPGELWVAGPQVMRGYLGDAEATARTVTGGWLRTGDLVRVDAEGFHWVLDRLKDLIKYKGYQVAPAELEAVLRAHPCVHAAAVVGAPDPVAGERPHAFVIPRGDVTEKELMAWVGQRVAPYKRIRSAEFVSALPISPAGKIARGLLRRRLAPVPGHVREGPVEGG